MHRWWRLCFLLGCNWSLFDRLVDWLLFLLVMNGRRWRRSGFFGSRDRLYWLHLRRWWGCVPLWLFFLVVNWLFMHDWRWRWCIQVLFGRCLDWLSIFIG